MSAPADPLVRRRLVVRGVVQGVGFRPHVARLAAELGLVGTCRNDTTSVDIDVAGPGAAVAELARRVAEGAPPLARVEGVTDLPPGPDPLPSGFVIVPSQAGAGERTMLPPDTAPCAACLAEMGDPSDRRYRHPFITCTHCGPRLTIALDLPYDRASTTLADFPMCAACTAEYDDPTDRRYHAQPIGCHDCGPTVAWTAKGDERRDREEALAAAREMLAAGGVVAVKGLGGYHLACLATDEAAVARLRERKQRPTQPFAVMARGLALADEVVEVGAAAEVLEGPERPVVLLPGRPGSPLAEAVAPGLDEVGVMLPYTPLHHLLMEPGVGADLGLLVMTSGNVSGEPLCWRDEDALRRLTGIADGFLTHDRPVAVPVEDSVVAWSEATGPVPLRRSRGYVPLPVDLGDAGPVVLAAGAELKNTVALVRSGRAFVSGHVGDLETLASREAHDAVAGQLRRFHRATPDAVAADLHPRYASRAWASALAQDLEVPLVEVQHHHAHLASLAAEHHRLDEDLLGLVLDGTGYGCDATVWGGELLRLADGGAAADRVGHLGPVRLPGGDAGVRNPVRTAVVAALDAGLDLDDRRLAHVVAELADTERTFLAAAHRSGTGLTTTSSAGRLVDVAAGLLGVRSRVTYEAQAAIELEAAARRWRRTSDQVPVTPFALPVVDDDVPWLDPAPFVRDVLTAAADPTADVGALALAAHLGIARGMADLALDACGRHGVATVGLTGGVFVNRLLLEAVTAQLTGAGIEVLTHHVVPANDGGLALGQAAVAWRTQQTSKGAAPPPSSRRR